jgi:hypothetical protein
MELRCIIDPTINLTRHMALDWFAHNKKELVSVIDGLAYDTELLDTLKAIKSLPHKLDVVTGMVKIAVSDGVYNTVERGLIKKTILYWNIPAGGEDSVDYSEARNVLIST